MPRAMMLTMRNTARWLTQGVLLVVGLLFLLVAAFLVVNAFDESLSPEAAALRARRPNPYTAEDNLDIALLAFDRPQAASALAYAQARMSALQEDERELYNNPRSDSPRTELPGQLKYQEQGNRLCSFMTADCWTTLGSRTGDIQARLDANRELYRRYLALFGAKGYYEVEPENIYNFLFFPGEVRHLFLADVALQVKTGTPAAQRQALALLQQDCAMLRRILVGDSELTRKLMSVRLLQVTYALLADIVADPNVDVAGLSTGIEAILNTVQESDWRVGRAYAYEFRHGAHLMEMVHARPAQESFLEFWARMDDDPDVHPPRAHWWTPILVRVDRYAYQHNATLNLLAEKSLRYAQVADTEPGRLLSVQQAHRQWAAGITKLGWRYFYNPLGKFEVAMSGILDDDLVLGVYDVLAYERLVKLSYEIRKGGIKRDGIGQFIAAHPELAKHVVTGEPAAWNSAKRELSIVPARPDSFFSRRWRFSVPVLERRSVRD